MKDPVSRYNPKNAAFNFISGKLEIFWQTVNADHILQTYSERITRWDKDHDLKFSDFKKMLSGNVWFKQIEKKRDKFRAISYDKQKNRYYCTVFVVSKRNDTLFAVIISAYATKRSEYIKGYQEKFPEN